MPSPQSSTCATYGSVRSLDVTSKTSPSQEMVKSKTKRRSNDTTSSKHNPSPSPSSSSSVIYHDASQQEGGSEPHHASDHLVKQASVIATPRQQQQRTMQQSDTQHPFSPSTDSHLVPAPECSSAASFVTRHGPGPVLMLDSSFVSTEDTIQAHITAMKAYVDAFDAFFYQA